MTEFDRYSLKLLNLKKALLNLEEGLSLPESKVSRDAVIKRFELVIEQSWKTLRLHLINQGLQAIYPKQTFQEALKAGIIVDDKIWIAMLEDRNKAAHIYDDPSAEEIYKNIRVYYPIMQGLYGFLEKERG